MNKAFEKILKFIDEQIKIEESIAKSKNEGHPITHQYGANCMNVIKKICAGSRRRIQQRLDKS